MSTTNGYQNGHGRANGAAKPLGGGPRPNIGPLRLPPQNLEAEQGVIGAAMLDGRTLDDTAKVLPSADLFYRDTHQVIWRVILNLYRANKSTDVVSVEEELDRSGQLDSVGGMLGLAAFVESIPHTADAVYHAEIVRAKALQRQLIDVGTQMIREAYANAFTAEELLLAAQVRIFDLAEGRTENRVKTVGEILPVVMERIDQRTNGQQLTGIGSPWGDLDMITGGFHPEQFVILAARPSMGKTAMALNLADYVAFELRKRVLFVSLEMDRETLVERMVASRSPIDSHKIRSGIGIGTRELTSMGDAYAAMMQGPEAIKVDDSPSQGMLAIMATARGIARRSGLDMIIVDYIQLVDSEDDRVARQEQVAKISRRLKHLAREVRVPVVALSQLNRELEKREDRRPRMSDLRESGALEQDADLVLLLHRPEYFDPNDQPGIAELAVGKNRHGQTGMVKLAFLKHYMKFAELAPHAGVPPMHDEPF